MKKLFWLFILFSGCVATHGGYGNGGNGSQPEPKPKRVYPKLAAYWMKPNMTSQNAEKLAKFDLVIVDPENMVVNPEAVKLIKKRNPNVILLAYWNIMEMFEPQVGGRPLQSQLYQTVSSQYSSFWLSTPQGQPIYYWMQPKMRMLNLSSQCPVINGRQWNIYLADFLLDNVLNNSIWDGLFVDNLWDDVSWVKPGNIDVNNDGIADNPNGWQENLLVDSWWRQGINQFLTRIRQKKGKNFEIVGNEGNLFYLDKVQGKMFEDFPNSFLGGFDGTVQNYLTILDSTKSDLSIILLSKSDAQRVRYGLCAALLGNGYFAYYWDNTTWFDEFDVDLGNPVGPAMKVGNVYARNFEKGVVMVTTSKSAQVAVGSGFRKVDGTQASSVSLNTFDGAILIGKQGNLQGTPIVYKKIELTVTSDRTMKHVTSDIDNWKERPGTDNVYKAEPGTHYVNVEDMNGLWACDSRGTHFGVYINGVKLTRTVDNNQGGRNFVFTIKTDGSVSP